MAGRRTHGRYHAEGRSARPSPANLVGLEPAPETFAIPGHSGSNGLLGIERDERWRATTRRSRSRASAATGAGVNSGQGLSHFRGQGEPLPRRGCDPVPRPKCPQSRVKGTWGEAQVDDQGGPILAAKVVQLLTAIDTLGRDSVPGRAELRPGGRSGAAAPRAQRTPGIVSCIYK